MDKRFQKCNDRKNGWDGRTLYVFIQKTALLGNLLSLNGRLSFNTKKCL